MSTERLCEDQSFPRKSNFVLICKIAPKILWFVQIDHFLPPLYYNPIARFIQIGKVILFFLVNCSHHPSKKKFNVVDHTVYISPGEIFENVRWV